MRFFSSISVINIVKSKRILLKMRIKTDVAVTVLNRYCDITLCRAIYFPIAPCLEPKTPISKCENTQ